MTKLLINGHTTTKTHRSLAPVWNMPSAAFRKGSGQLYIKYTDPPSTWSHRTPRLDNTPRCGDSGSLNLEEKGYINGSKKKWAQMTSDKLKKEGPSQLKLLDCNTLQSGKCVQPLPWRNRQHVPPKCRYLHDTLSETKEAIYIYIHSPCSKYLSQVLSNLSLFNDTALTPEIVWLQYIC